jgi:3-hydroxy acid dehydrogenase/malonic semialdehyde reductase
VLINNASPLMPSAPSWEAAPEAIGALLDVNFRGVLKNCLAATVPGMKARGLGHIVNLGSMAGTWIFPGMSVYAMSKAAICAGRDEA